MRIINNQFTDPYFNMACEEYLLRICDTPTLMLWRNTRAVIIGKNQNAAEQVNTDFTKERSIPVIRRLTGGGAVFHDPGNINYSFFMPDDRLSLNFKAFADPIIKALRAFGIESELSGRNDLTVNGKKFSGTAQCTYYYNGVRKMLHHGTLLFDADTDSLSGALKVDEEKMRSKGIKSVRSRVTNLSPLLDAEHKGISPPEFMNLLFESFLSQDGSYEYRLTDSDIAGINILKEEKYLTDEWLYGKFGSPAQIKLKKRFPFGTVELSVTLSGDTIESCVISGDFFGKSDPAELSGRIEGQRISDLTLNDGDVADCVSGCTADDIITMLKEIKHI